MQKLVGYLSSFPYSELLISSMNLASAQPTMSWINHHKTMFSNYKYYNS